VPSPQQLIEQSLQSFEPPTVSQQSIQQSAVALTKPVFDALQFVTQPFQAPQQIMYGTYSGLVGLLTNDEELKGDFLRGFQAAGSFATFGLLDGREAQTRALRAGEFIRRMGGSEPMATWGGLIADLVLDPVNLVGGAGLAVKAAGTATASTRGGQAALRISRAVLQFNDALGAPVKTAFNLIPRGAELSVGAKVSAAEALGLVQRGRFYVPTIKGVSAITREKLAAAFGSPVLNYEFSVPSIMRGLVGGRTRTTVGEFAVPQALRRRLLPSKQARIDSAIDNLRDLQKVRLEVPGYEARTAGQQASAVRAAVSPESFFEPGQQTLGQPRPFAADLPISGAPQTRLTGMAESELRQIISGPRSLDDFVSVAPIDAMDRRVTQVLRARNNLAKGLNDEQAQKAFQLAYLISDGKELAQIARAKDDLVALEVATGKAGLYNEAIELVSQQIELDAVGGTLLEWSGMYRRGLGEGYEVVSANRRAFGVLSKYGDAYIEKVRSSGKPRQVRIDGPFAVGKLVERGFTQTQAVDVLKDIASYYGARQVANKQLGTVADALMQSPALKAKYGSLLIDKIPELVSALAYDKVPTVLGYRQTVSRSNLRGVSGAKRIQETPIEIIPGSEDIAASLKTFRAQALGGADRAGISPRKVRDYTISAARAAEMAEIQDLSVAALEQARGVGRAVAERSALQQTRKLVESEWGRILSTKNMKDWTGEQIRAFTEPGSAMREITPRDVDKYGVFEVGDVIPAIAYRAIQVYSAGAKSNGVGGVATLQRLINVWKAVKLGTPGSIIRNIIGGASQYYTAGGSPIDHAAGMIEMLKRFGDVKLRDEMLSAGLSLSSWSLSEAEAAADIARAASVGAKRTANWVDRLEELTGLRPSATGEKVTAVLAAINPQRIGFDVFSRTEQILKGGAYLAGKKSGLNPSEAAQFAEDVIFNYHARPLLAEFGSKSGLDPFSTFRIFASAQVLESLYEKPYRLAALSRAPSAADAGRSSEDAEKERASHDKYLQTQWTVPLMVRDEYGRMLYLPLRPLLNVGAVAEQADSYFDLKPDDVGGSVAYAALKGVDQIVRNSPYAQMVLSVIAGRGFGGRETYQSIGGGTAAAAAKQNPIEAVRIAALETLSIIGWPLQPGSPIAQRWASVLEQHIVNEDEAAQAAGLSSGKDFNRLSLEFTARVIRNALLIGSFGSYDRKPSPTSEPPEGAVSVGLRTIGLPITSVSTDKSSVAMTDTNKRILEIKRQIAALVGSGNPSDPSFSSSELGQLARTVQPNDLERAKADILRRVAVLTKQLEELQQRIK
jgi:hypothetical protein